MGFKNTFSDLRVMAKIRAKSRASLKNTMIQAREYLQDRLTSGKSITGKQYQYSEKYAKAKKDNGARSPVNWRDTGTLRGAIDFVVKANKNILTGTLGYRNDSFQGISNQEKLEYLTARFKGMWALSKSEIKNLMDLYKREFKR